MVNSKYLTPEDVERVSLATERLQEEIVDFETKIDNIEKLLVRYAEERKGYVQDVVLAAFDSGVRDLEGKLGFFRGELKERQDLRNKYENRNV